MKIDKNFIIKNLITICCVASVVFLLLPMCSVSSEVSTKLPGMDIDTSMSFTGFSTLNVSFFGILLILCPAVLVAMNYVKQLDKYKSILAIILPLVSIIVLIILLFICKSGSSSASIGSVEAKTSVTPGIGFFLLLISYIATLIAGAMTFYGLKLSKEGVSDFKNRIANEGIAGMAAAAAENSASNTADGFSSQAGGASDSQFVSGIADKMSSVRDNVMSSVSNMASNKNSNANSNMNSGTSSAAASGTPVRKTSNIKQSEEILSLISNLSEMKEKGILTEEEFTLKKQELLSQI